MEQTVYNPNLIILIAYYIITLLVSVWIFYDPKPNFDSVVKALVLIGLCWLIIPIVGFGLAFDYLMLKRERWRATRR